MSTEPSSQEPSEKQRWGDPAAKQIADEHGRIMALLEALEIAADPTVMRDASEALKPLLMRHFDEEQRPGGFYDEIERARPELCTRIDGLRNQHRDMLGVLEGLLRGIAELAAQFEHLEQDRDRFVGMLRRHENIESDLLSDAWWTDLGVGY